MEIKPILRKAAAIGIGASLMFVLMRFFAIPTGIPYTNINFGMVILSVFAAIFGPVAGFMIGFIGHTLVDLSWGGVWWSWVISSAFFGLAVGSFRKYYKLEEGGFGLKQALIFNAVQAVANIAAYIFIARILDLFFYDQPIDKVTLQGFVAAGINIAVVLLFGSLLAVFYSQTRTMVDSLNKEARIEKQSGINRLLKAVWPKLALGLFSASTLLTMLISELVTRQMDNYERTVTEMTRNHLESAVQTLATLASAEELDLFHTVEDMERPEYEKIRKRLIKFGEDYNVLFAYYWREYDEGLLQYIVDNDTNPETRVGPEDFEAIVDDVEFAALLGKVGVTDLGSYSDGWQGLLSAFAPVYDSEGNVYCIAGVDIKDEFIFLQRQDAQNLTLFKLIIIPISAIFGILSMILYRRKAIQIEEAHVRLQYFNNNLRRAFSTYLSEDVVEEIISDPVRLQLGGEKRYMTALFTDVQGFASIAEMLNPEQLVELLNYYLSTMSDVILERKGTIDKYEGDAIVAFYGAPLQMPDHALQACITAIVMKRLEGEVNNHIARHNLSPTPLHTRVGINSGDMVVGNMGTQKKMNYTIISNAVNLAARLEGVNKQYGTYILASEDTVTETQGKILTRKLDRIKVAGINTPVRIYEILETHADAPAALHEMVKLFDKALELFEGRNWNEALNTFTNIQRRFPNDKPTSLYIHRCRTYTQYPPLDDWDGVFVFDEK